MLGYVNMFNRGVGQVQTDLKENGNQPAEFNVNLITAFKVDVYVAQSHVTDNGDKVGGKVGGKMAVIMSPVCPQLCPQFCYKLSQVCPKLAVSHYPDATAILIALCIETIIERIDGKDQRKE